MFSGLLLPYCRRFSHTGSDFPQVSSMGSSTAVCSCVLVQLRFPQVCSMGSSTCAPVLFYSMGSTACALLPQAPSSTLCTFRSCAIHNVYVHCAYVRMHSCNFVYMGNFGLHYFCRRTGTTPLDKNYARCTLVNTNQRISCCQYKTP